MSDITRSQLKKNELADLVVLAVEWIKKNQSLFFGIAGTAVMIIFFGIFFFARYQSLGSRADEKFAMGQAMLLQGQPDQGLKTLDEVITQYSRTEAASKARLTKAEYLLEKKQLDEAEKTILPAIENARPKTVIPLAYSILGTIREEAGKYKEAISLQRTFLDRYPDHFLAPRAYESLARLYELSGSPAEAKSTYEKLATLYPASLWAQRAQEHIAALSAQNVPSPGKPALRSNTVLPSPEPLSK